MTTSEKIAYLKGLAEGLGLGRETKEEKLIAAIIDTLDCIARDLEDLEETSFDLGEEIDAISDDLSDLENVVYDEFDDDDCCCGEFEEDCCCDDHEHGHDGSCCGGHGHHGGHGSCCGGHGHHDRLMYEVTCPACDNTITIDEEVLNLGSIKCPSCGGTLEFDFGDDDGEDKPEEEKE